MQQDDVPEADLSDSAGDAGDLQQTPFTSADRDEQSGSFVNALSKAINDHPAVTPDGHIALLGQAAMQLAIQRGVKKKRFISAMNTYYIKLLKMMK